MAPKASLGLAVPRVLLHPHLLPGPLTLHEAPPYLAILLTPRLSFHLSRSSAWAFPWHASSCGCPVRERGGPRRKGGKEKRKKRLPERDGTSTKPTTLSSPSHAQVETPGWGPRIQRRTSHPAPAPSPSCWDGCSPGFIFPGYLAEHQAPSPCPPYHESTGPGVTKTGRQKQHLPGACADLSSISWKEAAGHKTGSSLHD